MINLAHNYLTRGFWGDEAWTSMISQLPYMDMLKTTAADFHPPAYYTVIELVYKIFPPTEVVTRLVSVLFYLLTAFLVFKLGSSIKNRSFGVVTMLLTLVAPIFFTYAFEARNYTLFSFSATGSFYYLILLSKKITRKNSIGFVAFSTLGIYTHYYMFFVLFSQALYVLLVDRKILFHMIKLYAICAIFYILWIPFLYRQLTSVSESYWIGGINTKTHFEALIRILGGEHKSIYRNILFTSIVISLLVGLYKHFVRTRFEKYYLLIWLWAIIPFILASLPGLTILNFKLPFRPIFFWRYLIEAAVPFSILVSLCLVSLPKQYAKASLSLVFILSLFICLQTFSRYPYTFRQAYEDRVIGNIKEEDKIVTILPSFAEVFYYRNYFGLSNELIVRPDGLVQFSGKSLLDAYVENGEVKILSEIKEPFFEASPGPKIEYIQGQDL